MEIKILASGSSGNCYLINDGKTSLLLDAGISMKQIRTGCGFRLHEIAGCLVTHSHGDHSKSVKHLLEASVSVYMSALEINALGLGPHHRLHALASTDQDSYRCFPLGSFNVLPFQVEHDTPEAVGYLVGSTNTGEKLLYFTDTYYLKHRFSGLTHILGECNYDRETLWENINSGEVPADQAIRLFSSHMSLGNFLAFLKANDIKRLRQIYVCHMSDKNGSEEKIRRAIQEQTGAEVYVC